jgi:rSAM/selenodomain-associated transferase 2
VLTPLASGRPRISVIMPTLNEASTISAALAALGRELPDEVVVVDASSPDGTAELAQTAGACVVISARGRGVQQNRGAEAASGDLFLFLHADCRLDRGALDCIREFVAANPKAPGGCLRMRVGGAELMFRSIDMAAHLRAGVLGIPYGDQAMFVPRWAFERVGGFPETPLMDDVLLALKLRRLGRLALLPARVHVSPRRWRKHGIIGQTLRNWIITLLAVFGVPTAILARYYPLVR